MTTQFDFFEGTATVDSTTPRVTVRKSGQLVLTEAAVDLLGEGVEAVQIGYNEQTKAVGIKPAVEGGRGVLKLRAQPNGRFRLVDAKRFLAHHGLSIDNARGVAVEAFGAGVVGFRLAGEEAAAEEPVKATKGGGRRKTVAV